MTKQKSISSTSREDIIEKIYPLADDYMFTAVMQHKDACKRLLEAIFGKGKISRIEYQDPEVQKSIRFRPNSKGVRLDVFIEGEDVAYNVELQNANKEGLFKRARFYSSMLDSYMTKRGAKYSELKKSYVIFFCTFDPYLEGDTLYELEWTVKGKPHLNGRDKSISSNFIIHKVLFQFSENAFYLANPKPIFTKLIL